MRLLDQTRLKLFVDRFDMVIKNEECLSCQVVITEGGWGRVIEKAEGIHTLMELAGDGKVICRRLQALQCSLAEVSISELDQ